MKINHLIASTAIFTSISYLAQATPEGWTHDFSTAKKQAAEQKKDLLIDFTGSDWCGWCIKLNKEVFQENTFKKSAPNNFILVEIDFPREKSKLTPEIQKQNTELGEQYNVQGYPSIILCDASGLPYAQTGYQQGGPENYLKHLDTLKKIKTTRDEAFNAAEQTTGTERAKLYIKGLQSLKNSGLEPNTINKFYASIIEKIKEADPKDETGFSKTTQSTEKAAKLNAELQEIAQKGDLNAILTRIDTALKDPEIDQNITLKLLTTKSMLLLQDNKPEEAIKIHEQALTNNSYSKEQQQQLYVSLAGIYIHTKNATEAEKALNKAHQLDPNTEIGKNIDQMKEHMKSYLKKETEKEEHTQKDTNKTPN